VVSGEDRGEHMSFCGDDEAVVDPFHIVGTRGELFVVSQFKSFVYVVDVRVSINSALRVCLTSVRVTQELDLIPHFMRGYSL
jgi:hypothetical protein